MKSHMYSEARENYLCRQPQLSHRVNKNVTGEGACHHDVLKAREASFRVKLGAIMASQSVRVRFIPQ
jgi:hypothetical protein